MSVQEAELAVGPVSTPEDVGGSLVREAFRRLRRNPVAIIGAAMIVVFVLVAALAPWLAPYDPEAQVGLDQIRPGQIPGPSGDHLLGMDDLGRDELSRILYGARQSLIIGVVSLSVGMSAGIALGTLAGGFGGWVDNLVMRLVDIMLSVPSLLFAIGVAAVLGSSLTSVMIAIGVVQIPIFARLLRGQMIGQRDSDYVLAATAVGVRRRTIVFRHVLPNSLTPVLVQGTLALATAIVDAAGLAFLGLSGNDPSTPEWGRMLADSKDYLDSAPQLMILPGLAIVFAALGFTLLGESLREALDPKYRR